MTADPGSRRLDIEGLRAVAVVLVMLYHAGLPPVAGFLGVDVFFVISGFLITGLLVRELAESGRISWTAFIARRIRRLLPAAVLVLAVTAVGTWFLVPGLRRHEYGQDIVWSALYAINWLLASRAVSYLQSDALPSPVQHYWSLAVEEQFYIVWPLLLLITCVLLRRAPRLCVVAALLAVLCVPSFLWSIRLTAEEPEAAYFVTTTRIWELGLGAGLAVFLASRPEPADPSTRHTGAPPAITLGVLGMALVLGTALFLPRTAGWPGAWAAVPTVGTALLLYAGWSAPGRGLAAALSRRPLVWVGGLSYSLYLWHWPMRVLGEWWLGTSRWVPIVAVAASVLPAWAAHRFIEAPIHHGRGWVGSAVGRAPRRWLLAGAVLSLTGVLAGSAMYAARSPFRTTPPPGSTEVAVGAMALGDPPSAAAVSVPSDWLTPDPLRAGTDRPDADVDHCQVDVRATTPVRCDFGVHDGPVTVALVGDSKAMQWLPALQARAGERGWRIVTYGKGSCTFSAAHASRAGAAYPECDVWNRAVQAQLLADPPDLVVTSANPSVLREGERTPGEIAQTGFAAQWRQLTEADIPVLVIANSPRSPDDLDVCAARHPGDLDRCAYDRDGAVGHIGNEALAGAAASVPAVEFLDLTAWLCPGERCPIAVGHMTIARAGDHVTATYARSLASVIGASVDQVLARVG